MNQETLYVGEIMNTAYGYGEIFEKKHFKETIEVEFEGYMFQAIRNYDAILKSMYGNYMKLPPVEKQVSHHEFECWYKEGF